MIGNIKINKITILIILSIATCMSSTPYIIHYLFGNKYVIISTLLTILLAFYSYKYYKTDNWCKILFIWGSSYLLYGILSIILNADTSGFRTAIAIIVKLIYIAASSQILKLNINKFTNIFVKANIIIIFFSIILFFILLIFPYDPITFIKNDGRVHYIFAPLGATNVRYLLGNLVFIRIAGIADEPGALALIITYLLAINEISLKSTIYRRILTIGAILTFSFAFYITSIPLIVYWLKHKILKLKSIFFVLLIIGFSTTLITKESYVYNAIDHFVLSRFEIDDSGKLKGDNRSKSFNEQLKGFYSSPITGVGNSEESIYKYSLGDPSFVSFLGMYGIWGYLFFYIPFFYLFLTRKQYRLLFLFIGLNYLQRPGIEDMFTLISLSIIYYNTKNYNIK